MAKKKTTKTSKEKTASSLSEVFDLKNIFHNERTNFIFGAALFIVAGFMIWSFVSFLATGAADMSIIETPKEGEILNEMYAVSGSRSAMYVQLIEEETRTAVIVYDFSVGQYIELDCNTSGDSAPEIKRIFWQNNDTVGILFDNRTVSLFDAGHGDLKATVSLDGTSQEPISAAAVSEDTFAVLCRDSHLYEMNSDGATGRSCKLDFSDEYRNDIYESDNSDAALFEIKPSADKNRVYAVWDKSQAWLLDSSKFTVRYRIDGFTAAPAADDKVFISDEERNKIGFFPIYTTQQLLSAARDYLSALGEA